MKRDISINQYYHIYNRGNDKKNIFLDERDFVRFLFLILYMQSPVVLSNIGQIITNFIKHRMFNISKDTLNKIISNRTVELIEFTIMPNHFHIIVKEIIEGGISKYMQRVQDAYTKYFNIKYGRTGHLLQGSYKNVRIKNNTQLLHLSAYIHKNPRELKRYKDKENQYPWSSYQDFINKNRWAELLKTDIIIGQFNNQNEYEEFVKTSPAKLTLDEKITLEQN